MYKDLRTESTAYQSPNSNDSTTFRPLKTTPQRLFFPKAAPNLDSVPSTERTLLFTKRTESDECDPLTSRSFKASPMHRHKASLNDANKVLFKQEFDGDYGTNEMASPQPKIKRSSSNTHINILTDRNDKNFQSYINYLDTCEKSSHDAAIFRRKMLNKGENFRKAEVIKAARNEDSTEDLKTVYSKQFIKAIQAHQQNSQSSRLRFSEKGQ